MDPFGKLPPELRVEVFIQLRSKPFILELLAASPIMLQQYVTHKSYITQAILGSDLDGDMVQDAMCILLFPRGDPNAPGLSCPAHDVLVERHLVAWAAQRLPNPLQTPNNSKLLYQLERLHSRLILFIEDYLTKATAVFPPRAYLCLPDRSVQSHLAFKGRRIATRCDATLLTSEERIRFLRAFLLFELMCKDSRVRWHQYFSEWLDERPSYKCRNRMHKPSEREAIRCVHSYVKSLYAALFAHAVDDAWLPDIPPRCSTYATGLLYPDSFHVSSDFYAHDMDQGRDFSWALGKLARLGLDPVATFTQAATLGRQGRERLRDCLWGFSKKRQVFVASTGPFRGHSSLYLGERSEDEKTQFDEQGPGLYTMLHPRTARFRGVQREIYRQRAWAFLDDDRLYPAASPLPPLPTWDELGEQCDKNQHVEGWFEEPSQTRALRRSQKWHDAQASEASCTQPTAQKSDEPELRPGPEPGVDGQHVRLPSTLAECSLGIRPFWH
ncbi:hypothetical protein S40288_01558 [Stachybotrys chartarum IBT 40288]|nr:hypothetical protein S40288_01558 [Stachybotrys chartarum IBT 40288]